MRVVYITKQWVSAAHIPGTQNTEGERFSRNFSETIEWKLSTHLLQKISSMFGNPTLDLFASHVNYQIHRYISWNPDPKALTIDAFSIKWNTEFYYTSFQLAREGDNKIIQRQNKSNCSYTQIAHATLVPQPLEKSDKRYDYHTIRKEFNTTPGSTKSSTTTPKASTKITPNRSTTQDIINASLRKSTWQKYFYYRNAGKNIVQRKTQFVIVLQLSNF